LKGEGRGVKHCCGWVIFAVVLALGWGAARLILSATAEYPSLGELALYPVNELSGFTLSIEEPVWSPFRGYTLRYGIEIDSKEVCVASDEESAFEQLEMLSDGVWHRLSCRRATFNPVSFELGGAGNSGFYGSLVQKYAGYGTRLMPGSYRLTVRLTDRQGEDHRLAAPFEVG